MSPLNGGRLSYCLMYCFTLLECGTLNGGYNIAVIASMLINSVRPVNTYMRGYATTSYACQHYLQNLLSHASNIYYEI